MSTECIIEDIIPGSSECEVPAKKVFDEMRNLIDKISELKDKYDLSQIIDNSFMDVFIDVTKTVHTFLMDGKENCVQKHIEELKAYSCVTTCCIFMKTFAYHVQDLLENIEKQRHDVEARRVKRNLINAAGILWRSSKRIDEMGNIVKKMINQQGNDLQDGNLIEFGLHFDILVIDLDYCASVLIHAKEELDRLFAEKRGFFTRWSTLAGSTGVSAVAIPVVAIAHLMSLLLPMIGTYCNIGAVTAVDLSILGYMVYKMSQNLDTIEKDIQTQFRALDLNSDSLRNILSNLKRQSETVGNAKKLQDMKEENRRLREKSAALKEQKLAQ